MQRLEISEIINFIEKGKTFEAVSADGGFVIKINKYLPYCCTAIHDGSKLRPELTSKIALDGYERWYEEDPHTGDFIASMPITLIGLDSRYEYDLNRKTEDCVHIEAWGKKVWKKKLTTKEIALSKKKHTDYYKVTHALIKKLEDLFGGCIVYDLHSYNHDRWTREVPLFNIGTENINQKKYGSFVDNWVKELSKIKLHDIASQANCNDVFYGRGYNLEYITTNFKKTLVLATEVKKVFCNELTGEIYPNLIKKLQQQLKTAILNNANFFIQENTNWKLKKTNSLLDKKIDKAIVDVDAKLAKAVRNFELLAYVNPNNVKTEKAKFFKSKYTEPPVFKYNPIRIEPYALKQELGLLKTQDISDVSIRHLYESVINSYHDKADLLSSLNTKKFFYNSLLYFGRPTKTDIINAEYIMHLPAVTGEPKTPPALGVEQAIKAFKTGLESYGFESKIEISNRVISQVMVLNSKKTILFRPDAKFSRKEINALVEHEIGVHMVTTMNSSANKLKVFNLGLPRNTMTQEGLAILSEYLSGNITMKRLKKLALRVIVVDMMCNGANFVECFNYVKDNYISDENDVFSLVTRIFRGGGFTKDHLYLSGFVKILRFWEKNNSLNPLLVGKTSFAFYNTIQEMIERDMVSQPKYITHSFVNPQADKNSEIYQYILSGLK
jgi:uncharacterized protein (TIGR02421 family)